MGAGGAPALGGVQRLWEGQPCPCSVADADTGEDSKLWCWTVSKPAGQLLLLQFEIQCGASFRRGSAEHLSSGVSGSRAGSHVKAELVPSLVTVSVFNLCPCSLRAGGAGPPAQGCYLQDIVLTLAVTLLGSSWYLCAHTPLVSSPKAVSGTLCCSFREGGSPRGAVHQQRGRAVQQPAWR